MPDSTGKNPTRNVRIQIYSRKEFNAIFGKGGWVEKYGLGAMNDDEVRVVHDPVLQLKLDDEAIMNDEKNRLRREAAEKKKAEVKNKPGPKPKTDS